MTDPTPTLGAVAERLRRNGFEPVSALFPYGQITDVHPMRHAPWRPHLISEHPATIVIRHPLAVLVLTPIEDRVLAERARAVLTRRGLLDGPARVGSDKRESRPVRLGEAFQRLTSLEALNGAVMIDQQYNDGTAIRFALLPLDGQWRDRDLLSVSAAELPELSDVDGLLSELDKLPYAITDERKPAKKPSRLAFIGR